MDGWLWPTRLENLWFHPTVVLSVICSSFDVVSWTFQTLRWNLSWTFLNFILFIAQFISLKAPFTYVVSKYSTKCKVVSDIIHFKSLINNWVLKMQFIIAVINISFTSTLITYKCKNNFSASEKLPS